jgi:hypothetical protein
MMTKIAELLISFVLRRRRSPELRASPNISK